MGNHPHPSSCHLQLPHEIGETIIFIIASKSSCHDWPIADRECFIITNGTPRRSRERKKRSGEREINRNTKNYEINIYDLHVFCPTAVYQLFEVRMICIIACLSAHDDDNHEDMMRRMMGWWVKRDWQAVERPTECIFFTTFAECVFWPKRNEERERKRWWKSMMKDAEMIMKVMKWERSKS